MQFKCLYFYWNAHTEQLFFDKLDSSLFLESLMRSEWKIWPLSPPISFHFFARLSSLKSKECGGVTRVDSSGSVTVAKRWPFSAHQGTDVSTLPWTSTISRNMLQKRPSIKKEPHQHQRRSFKSAGRNVTRRKINSSRSRHHWLGRWRLSALFAFPHWFGLAVLYSPAS